MDPASNGVRYLRLRSRPEKNDAQNARRRCTYAGTVFYRASRNTVVEQIATNLAVFGLIACVSILRKLCCCV